MLPKTLSRRLAIFCCAAALTLPRPFLHAQPQDVFPVRSGTSAFSLNGEWQFKYIAGSDIGSDTAFSDPSFAGASAWKTIPVPAHWELHNFAEPKYGKVDDGTGLYRRTFRVPAAWGGQRIFLRFEGVLYGLEAFVNGRSVGTWASSYNPVSFDITDALKPDADNSLAVRVSTHPKGWEFDCNDCWALSGIYRDVALFAVPTLHFKDLTTRTTLAADGAAELNVDVVGTAAGSVGGKLIGPDDATAQEFHVQLDERGHGVAAIKVSQPKLWTAETPSLYRLQLALQSGGKTVQQIEEKIGLRQITIEDGVLKLNGRPIKLHGVDHHDIWPKEGRVATEELMRRDLELMRAANINFIRTSHYPPHPRFIELCDELGFYVMCEVPFGYGDEHLEDESYQEILHTRANATVKRDKNRASVIVWSVGNENPNTPLTFATGKRVKELDPTRPMCFPQVGSYFERSYQELPEWVDIYAPHYPVVKTLERYAKELKRPIIVTEYAHALGLATDRIQDEWEIMQKNPRFAGGAVWMFQDQGIQRFAEKPTQISAPSLVVRPDWVTSYDTSGNQGMDGIVYSDRTPQPDYWEVQKVYSPVQIAEQTLTAVPGAQKFSLHLSNRFDFRTLSGCVLEWSLLENGAPVQTGDIPLTTAARSDETVTVSTDIPKDFAENYYALEARCVDETGRTLIRRVIRLVATNKASPTTEFFASQRFMGSNTIEAGNELVVKNQHLTVTFDRRTGAISLRSAGGTLLAEGFRPHIGRRFTEAETLRAKNGSVWTGTFLRNPTDLEAEIFGTSAGATLSIKAKYIREGIPDQFLEGFCLLTATPQNTLEVSYRYTLHNATGTMLEAGLSMVVPPAFSEFRWAGQGPFAGYPGKDRLNEFGIHHLSRDDIRFQGNRRDVDLATLTSPAGDGVLLFANKSDIAVENSEEGTVLSHNALVSGRGNKGVGPESPINANEVQSISGKFRLMPLSQAWPAPVVRWFGPPEKSVPVEKPFLRSYDQ